MAPDVVARVVVKGLGKVTLESGKPPGAVRYELEILGDGNARTYSESVMLDAVTLVGVKPTLRAVTLDGRPGAIAVLEATYRKDRDRWTESTAIACGIDSLRATSCVLRSWGGRAKSCTLKLEADGAVVPSCGAREVLSVDNNAIERAMDEAVKAYDRADYDTAKKHATAVLTVQPDNVRMLRLATSIACIASDAAAAKQHAARLPARDRKQMATRCSRYGVTL